VGRRSYWRKVEAVITPAPGTFLGFAMADFIVELALLLAYLVMDRQKRRNYRAELITLAQGSQT